jgi:phosphoglucosamine mutase
LSRRYFGTDGIRGKAGRHPITGEFAFQLGNAAGHVLKQKAVSRPFVIIGQDTRASSDMLSYAIGSGLQSAGMNTLYVSVMPTPAVAYLCRYYQATAGVMISASHNAYKDNGIKFFSNKGEKIDDETEIAIEKRLSETTYYASSDKLGHTLACHKPEMPYIEFCKSILTAKNYDLSQFKLVIDCANGSFSNIAPWLLHQLNAKVIVTCAHPDGVNINQNCGAVSTQHLAYEVLNHRADLGMAFDGDGDRLIMIDSEGNVVDGDDILYLLAFDKYQNNELSGGVVGTLMTNYGIEMALKTLNIPLERTKVGDRYVLEKMKTLGWCLGGETSGHIPYDRGWFDNSSIGA